MTQRRTHSLPPVLHSTVYPQNLEMLSFKNMIQNDRNKTLHMESKAKHKYTVPFSSWIHSHSLQELQVNISSTADADLFYGFVHRMSDYVSLTPRNLITKHSVLSTRCPTTVSFEFRIPSIYFIDARHLNITELSLSNETHELIPLMIISNRDLCLETAKHRALAMTWHTNMSRSI
eukprot:15281_1